MITSAEEFTRLRTSEIKEEYNRAAYDEASLSVWLDVIEKFSDMRCWVAHNKTVPVEILEKLSRDNDVNVRCVGASKRKLPESVQLILARDEDYSVRNFLVNNKKIAKSVLNVLSNDVELSIREKAKEILLHYPDDFE